jgi:hypothetical protein
MNESSIICTLFVYCKVRCCAVLYCVSLCSDTDSGDAELISMAYPVQLIKQGTS